METKFMKPVSVIMTLFSMFMVSNAIQLDNSQLVTLWGISTIVWLVAIKLWWSE